MPFGTTAKSAACHRNGGLWRSLGCGNTLACLCALLFLAIQVHAGLLPQPTPVYYTVVSASFGNLLYSMHYEEYGNSDAGYTLSLGRYFSPSIHEWTDVPQNKYYLRNENYICTQYEVNVTETTRIVQGATAFLVNVIRDDIQFTNAGLVTNVRTQPSMHYTVQLSWASTSNSGFTSVESLLKQAMAMAGVATGGQYSYSVTVDAYYAADGSGNLVAAGGGYIPLRYSINGQRSDGRQLNILFDFMQFTVLDDDSAAYALYTPWCYAASSVDALPPAVPVPQSLPAANTTIPIWGGGRVFVEVTSSNHAPVQANALLRPEHGLQLEIRLNDPTRYTWNSFLYNYDFVDQRNFQFAKGALYTLNGTDADPYYIYTDAFGVCQGSVINPSNVSPLQWLNGGMLNTIFVDEANFFADAQPVSPRETVNGIVTDAWTTRKVSSYNGVLYNFTVTMYVTAAGWGNVGRMHTTLERQLVRLAYNGLSTNASGKQSAYTLQMDFFMQFAMHWQTYESIFDPSRYICPHVNTGESVLPILPPQFSVSVNEGWLNGMYSEQYTMYVDSTKKLRRVDGRFTAPNTFSMLSESPYNSYYMSLMEWSQNVTLTGGFSDLTVAAGVPYTSYSPSQATPCGDVTLPVNDFANMNALNFFDWLAVQDATQAKWYSSATRRGVDVDWYTLSGTYTESTGFIYLVNWDLFYLAADETRINTVPVAADLRVFVTNNPAINGYISVYYDFYNFRSNVPAGVFNTPAPTSCTGNMLLPIPFTQNKWFYQDPNPNLDNTPRTAPTWPSTFSMLIEGQLFLSSGDKNMYIARWYADFDNFRERLDVEPAFNISSVAGTPYKQGTYLYYYKPQGGNTFSFSSGIYVSYTGGKSCAANLLTTSNVNPLKQVAPGNLFDTFFPATTQDLAGKSTYYIYSRYSATRVNDIFSDEYRWNMNSTFGGSNYKGYQAIFVSIPEWNNNAQAAPYNNSRIPLGLQVSGTITSMTGQLIAQYNPTFTLTHYQGSNPGVAMFDAALLGCPTTPDSPWYNIYGTQSSTPVPVTPPSADSSSVSSATVIGAVVGVCGGLLVVLIAIKGYFFLKSRRPAATKYGGGKSSTADHSHDNELVGVGKVSSDDHTAENSLNNLVKETSVEVEVDTTNHAH